MDCLHRSVTGTKTPRANINSKRVHARMCVWMQKAHEVEQQTGPRGNLDYVDRVKLLEKEVSYYKDESNKAQAEVERLLDILREVETEKNDKDKKIAELER